MVPGAASGWWPSTWSCTAAASAGCWTRCRSPSFPSASSSSRRSTGSLTSPSRSAKETIDPYLSFPVLCGAGDGSETDCERRHDVLVDPMVWLCTRRTQWWKLTAQRCKIVPSSVISSLIFELSCRVAKWGHYFGPLVHPLTPSDLINLYFLFI